MDLAKSDISGRNFRHYGRTQTASQGRTDLIEERGTCLTVIYQGVPGEKSIRSWREPSLKPPGSSADTCLSQREEVITGDREMITVMDEAGTEERLPTLSFFSHNCNELVGCIFSDVFNGANTCKLSSRALCPMFIPHNRNTFFYIDWYPAGQHWTSYVKDFTSNIDNCLYD